MFGPARGGEKNLSPWNRLYPCRTILLGCPLQGTNILSLSVCLFLLGSWIDVRGRVDYNRLLMNESAYPLQGG